MSQENDEPVAPNSEPAAQPDVSQLANKIAHLIVTARWAVGVLVLVGAAGLFVLRKYVELETLSSDSERIREQVALLESRILAFEDVRASHSNVMQELGATKDRLRSAEQRIESFESVLAGRVPISKLRVRELEIVEDPDGDRTRIRMGAVGTSAHQHGYGMLIYDASGNPGVMLCSGRAEGEQPVQEMNSLTLFDPRRVHPAYWIRTSLVDLFGCVIREEWKDAGRRVKLRRSLRVPIDGTLQGNQRGAEPYVSYFDSKQQIIMQLPYVSSPGKSGPHLVGLLLKHADSERLRIYYTNRGVTDLPPEGEAVIDFGDRLQNTAPRVRIGAEQ